MIEKRLWRRRKIARGITHGLQGAAQSRTLHPQRMQQAKSLLLPYGILGQNRHARPSCHRPLNRLDVVKLGGDAVLHPVTPQRLLKPLPAAAGLLARDEVLPVQRPNLHRLTPPPRMLTPHHQPLLYLLQWLNRQPAQRRVDFPLNQREVCRAPLHRRNHLGRDVGLQAHRHIGITPAKAHNPIRQLIHPHPGRRRQLQLRPRQIMHIGGRSLRFLGQCHDALGIVLQHQPRLGQGCPAPAALKQLCPQHRL